MIFLIQGCFFQNQTWLGIGMSTEGCVATLERGLIWDMYAGIIRPNPNFPPQLIGGMVDHYGESTLSDVEVSNIQVGFVKKYDRRQDTIRYLFKVKDGNTWVGEYSGEAVGRGLSRCIITQVDDSFNDPFALRKVLGSDVIHSWKKQGE